MSVSSKISLKKLGKCAEELMRPDPSSFSAFLRNAHPSDTAYWVASLIGAHESTVEAWIYQKALPQARHLGPLLAVYGPGVLAAIFPTGPQWIENAISAERAREVEAQLADLTAELESLKGAK